MNNVSLEIAFQLVRITTRLDGLPAGREAVAKNIVHGGEQSPARLGVAMRLIVVGPGQEKDVAFLITGLVLVRSGSGPWSPGLINELRSKVK